MILESLALLNFALGIFDCWLTQRRIKEYGPKVELNRAIQWMSTRVGPQLSAIIGVMIPVFGWSYGLYFFQWGLLLAFLTGFNLKRFFVQARSIQLEKDARVYKILQEFRASESHPPFHELTSSEAREISKEDTNVR